MIRFLIFYSIICIIEAVLFKRIYDNGYIDRLLEKVYGNDAWKEKVKYKLPDTDYLYPVLFVGFFITSPIIWVLLIAALVKGIFNKLTGHEERNI